MNHMSIHTEEKGNQCEISQKRFNNKRSLKKHLSIHNTKRKRKNIKDEGENQNVIGHSNIDIDIGIDIDKGQYIEESDIIDEEVLLYYLMYRYSFMVI